MLMPVSSGHSCGAPPGDAAVQDILIWGIATAIAETGMSSPDYDSFGLWP